MGIEKGNKVKIDYTGKLEDGTVFDSSKHGDHSHPLEFEVGGGQVIKGFDDAVMGMEVGEEKTFKITPENGYGQHNPELKRKVKKEMLPKEQTPEVGMDLIVTTPEGQQFPTKIIEVGDEDITLDMNHPLAGKNLTFEIKVLEIN